MRIVVCAKEVLDPDAVNNYALAGNLTIGADGKTPEVSAIPRLINGYDEQALEAALRIKDSGVDCTISTVSIGTDQKDLLKKCFAMGADEIVAIDADTSALDGMATATLLAAYVKQSGGADLILCGRQASDDDQGVVPALIAEKLNIAMAPIARAVEVADGTLKVTRATPDGDEVVEGAAPAVVTVSNELGEPRFPTAKQKMKARREKPSIMSVADLGLSEADLVTQVPLVKQYVPEVQGNCEFLEGSAEDIAKQLLAKLRADSII